MQWLNVSFSASGFSERVALGSREFLDRARSWVKSVSSEQPDRSFLTRRVPFEKTFQGPA